MSQSKMTWWEAQKIANSIAEKAFEHLLGPIDKKINAHLRECYHRLVPAAVKETVLKYQVSSASNRITVSVLTDKGGDEEGRWKEVLTGDADEFLQSGRYSSDFEFQSVDETPLYSALCTERAPLRAQALALSTELTEQLTGRSAKAAMKAWPEAAGFIAEAFGITSHVEMVKPLEVLLAKYLPTLAAPKGE